MKITSIRLGHATNSSSSHSIVIAPGLRGSPPDTPGHYGWDDFVLSSPFSKSEYLAAQVFSCLRDILGADEPAATLTDSLLGVKPGVGEDAWDVDHNYRWALPQAWDGKYLDTDFVRDLADYISQEGLVIVGGNDNEPSEPVGEPLDMPLVSGRCYGDGLVARKDKGVWVLYNRSNGAKVRLDLSSKGEMETTNVVRPTWPELVDIKVTDYCDKACRYCYQGSSPTGKHANHRTLETLAHILEEHRVFEVAIGGGEPMSHPRIVDILQSFRYRGIVPNLTTRDQSWLNDDKKRTAVMSMVGAVGFSVETATEAERLIATMHYHEINQYKYAIQCVEGVAELEGIARTVKRSPQNPTIVLLGYKSTGRGATFKRSQHDYVPGFIKAADDLCLNLSVDTVIAAKYQRELDEAGIPRELYSTVDGITSAYVDATVGDDKIVVGRSSYEEGGRVEVDICDLYRAEEWPRP